MKKFVTNADVEEAVGLAWRLYPPQPYRRSTRKPHPPVPLEVIARELGVSRQAVEQTEKRALRKCRAWADANGYSLADLLDMIGR